jgi:hypothetical protein
MTSRSEMKRQTVMEGGTIDDAYLRIHAEEAGPLTPEQFHAGMGEARRIITRSAGYMFGGELTPFDPAFKILALRTLNQIQNGDTQLTLADLEHLMYVSRGGDTLAAVMKFINDTAQSGDCHACLVLSKKLAKMMELDKSSDIPEDPKSLLDTPEKRRIFEESQAAWDEAAKPMVEAIKRSEQITGEDLSIRINTKG